VEAGRRAAAAPRGLIVSPVRGPAGNVEFLLWAKVGGEERPLRVEEQLAHAAELAGR
jgi:hypothetical protein